MNSRIELGDVTPHNIKQLKRLNQVIFPVSYNDKFYKDKFGFEIIETKKNYYKRIEPADAHVLQKSLRSPYKNFSIQKCSY
uniref:N-alpha-acetyltransferase 50, NatE catalytic subunit n=1 Tax=Scophthalmus maximus TaxID=52904 RepID=A0A8D3CWP9_SCOMX